MLRLRDKRADLCYHPYYMQSALKVKRALDEKFNKVQNATAGFAFYVSVHDFVRFVESTSSFDAFLGGKAKRAGELPAKYFLLKQVYQGIEDIGTPTNADLGHDRFVAIRELNLIKKKDASDSNNSFWKRRELFRKLIGETYKTLGAHLSQ